MVLFENRLSGHVPAGIGGCSRLKTVWLQHNVLSGELPESLGACGELLMLCVCLLSLPYWNVLPFRFDPSRCLNINRNLER